MYQSTYTSCFLLFWEIILQIINFYAEINLWLNQLLVLI